MSRSRLAPAIGAEAAGAPSTAFGDPPPPSSTGEDARRRRGPDLRLLVDLFAYGLASAAALVCDYALLVTLTAAGLDYRVAAVVGFLAGMGVAYALSARFVFADRRAASRQREIAGFIAVGLGGLVLTQLLLWGLVAGADLPVALAKVPTAGLVFLFNFLCRRAFVFGGGTPA